MSEGQRREQVRLHAIVEGLVQGVNFRYYTVRRARSLGLTGWVANRRDGNVETLAEGSRGDIEEFLAFLREGPPSALVKRVVPQWERATGEFPDFGVIYL